MPTAPGFDPYAVLQILPTAEQEVVRAAFRALALKYHPDRDASRRAASKMADLNRAYRLLRDANSRAAHDRSRRGTVADIAAAPAPARPVAPVPTQASGSVLNFGRYAGWGLRDIARQDTEYVLWLSRHSSGIRYRTEIYTILRTMGVSAA
jgi:curved DNA-binding protein CbpA